MSNKNRAERCDRYHCNSHTSLDLEPEELPRVPVARVEMEAYKPDAGEEDHEDAEAEEGTDAEFLAGVDSHLPEDTRGDTDDCCESAVDISRERESRESSNLRHR